MLDQLMALDADILIFLNSFHVPVLDRFVMMFTGRWAWIPMYASLLYVLLRAYDTRRVVIFTLGIALAILLSDQIVAGVLRPIFQRLRPANLDNPLSEFVQVVDGYRGGRYGFPSCHGANSFALAVYMSLIIRRPRFVTFIFIWALLNCYTRNYLGVHYPGDIIVGAIIGSIIAALCAWTARKVAHTTRRSDWEVMGAPLLPKAEGALHKLKIFDATVLTGVGTAVVLLVMAIFRA
ncbi:MAG: phosphatase PAP2 family protein [Barnesiella sp.]|nr:phosphatase PAP2 family protein [Bacteroidales bacterium]MBD5250323.1 phosphatase PAP2 family protein [Barnesiella sp.]